MRGALPGTTGLKENQRQFGMDPADGYASAGLLAWRAGWPAGL